MDKILGITDHILSKLESMASPFQSDSDDMSPSPLEIISRGIWDQALFTTYALSLSFYETQLHKLGLARNGCRDIRIIADVDGYQMSLCERQSHRVGNEYRLHPAAMPKGVFHPKIVWLGGQKMDIILLGSGNLTFGGFGKNLECLEVIRSDHHPEFFHQIAGMIGEWELRQDLRFTERSWLPLWRARGETVGRAAGGTPPSAWKKDGGPRLLHSTSRSIGSQLVELAMSLGKVAEVRSLSPYYDSDGSGILELAGGMGATTLSIGLPTGREKATTFPFGKADARFIRIRAMHLHASLPAQQKTSHAKIIEIIMEDGSGLLVTGSVNATRKSLLTVDNIETAIVRRMLDMTDSPFRWDPAPTPRIYNTSEFKKAGLGQRVVVDARITAAGAITGTLLTGSDPSGTWETVLQKSDGTSRRFNLIVDASGRFAASLQDLQLFEYSSGLQLRVSRNGSSGIGWVSVEGLLTAARRNFLSPAVLLKLLGSEADENDEAELLRYLATSAQRHLFAFASEITSGRKPRSAASTDFAGDSAWDTIPVAWLAPSAIIPVPTSTLATRDPQDAVLDGLMKRIRTNIMTQRRKEILSLEVDEATDEKGAAREQKERERVRKALTVNLNEFQERLGSLSRAAPTGPVRSAALCMWLEVAFSILHRRLGERDGTIGFLNRWYHTVLPSQRLSNSTPALTAHVLSTLLTLAAIEIARDHDASQLRRILGELHEMLWCYCDPLPVDQAAEDSGILDPAHPPLVSDLLDSLPNAPSLKETLRQVTAVRTPRQQLEAVNKGGWPTDLTEFPILSLPVGGEIQRRLARGGFRIGKLSSSAQSCPVCHQNLLQSTRLKMKSNRVGICDRCSEILVLTF